MIRSPLRLSTAAALSITKKTTTNKKKNIIIIWKKRWSFTLYSLFALVNRVDCCAFLDDSHSQYFLYFSKKWIWEIQKQIERTVDLWPDDPAVTLSDGCSLFFFHLIRISSAQNQRFRIYSRLYNDFDLGISIQYVDSLSQMEPGKGAACSFLRSFFRPFLGGLRIYTPPPSSNPKKKGEE